MKVQQETLPFRPITIKLEERQEAEALFNLIDKLESFRVHENCPIKHTDFCRAEVEVMRKISNSRTTGKVTI